MRRTGWKICTTRLPSLVQCWNSSSRFECLSVVNMQSFCLFLSLQAMGMSTGKLSDILSDSMKVKEQLYVE